MAQASLPANPIAAGVPFEEDGLHHGFLRLPYSRDDSAWGSVMIPITVARNGEGPTALLTGGNHGDEYEGPVALQALARALDPTLLRGRVIVVPFMNQPAVRAGTRTSPLDGGNLNRSFPGRPDGTPTARIADYFTRTLIPMADIVLDFHSGGRTLDFLPFAAAHRLEDPQQEAACIAAMRAFNAPYSMVLLEIDNAGMFDTEAEAQGKAFVSTELGGGGTATARLIAIARKGARNILIHAGILQGEAERGPSVDLDMPGMECFVFCEHEGLVEPLVDLGEDVARGAPITRIWPVGRSGIDPVEYRAHRGGLLAGRHFPGLVKPGDCLAVVAEAR